MNKRVVLVTHGAMIAALYIALTYLANAFGLASGAIQVRLSEALTVLPFFTPAAVPGLFIGCIISNLLTGCVALDTVFGSLATLLGALGTRYLAKKRLLAPVFPILANTAVIPFLLRYVYGIPGSLGYFFLTVFVGEVISCGILGSILSGIVQKTKAFRN